MKLLVLHILLLGLLFGGMTSFNLQTTQYFVQFRVISIPDAEAAAAIDSKMSSKSGILESRTDHVTSTYFCLLRMDADYTRQDFENWFSKMGYSITCYNRGIQNVDLMVSPHVLKNCVEETKE